MTGGCRAATSIGSRFDSNPMFQTHPELLARQPPDETVLWRYMDIAKFFAIVESKTLFFPRVTTFQQQDPFEGNPPRAFVNRLKANPPSTVGQNARSREELIKGDLENLAGIRRFVCASCWHANVGESAAMWSLYSRAGEGIALRTTFAGIRDAVRGVDQNVHGGLVEYVDFDKYDEQFNLLSCALLKRKSFEHEREFRLLILDNSAPDLGPGVAVPINVDNLLGDVMVSPTTPDWLVDLLRKMLQRYAYKFRLSKSTLLDGPTYYDRGDRA